MGNLKIYEGLLLVVMMIAGDGSRDGRCLAMQMKSCLMKIAPVDSHADEKPVDNYLSLETFTEFPGGECNNYTHVE